MVPQIPCCFRSWPSLYDIARSWNLTLVVTKTEMFVNNEIFCNLLKTSAASARLIVQFPVNHFVNMVPYKPCALLCVAFLMLPQTGNCHIDRHAEKLRACGTILLDLPRDLALSFCSSYVGTTKPTATSKPSISTHAYSISSATLEPSHTSITV